MLALPAVAAAVAALGRNPFLAPPPAAPARAGTRPAPACARPAVPTVPPGAVLVAAGAGTRVYRLKGGGYLTIPEKRKPGSP